MRTRSVCASSLGCEPHSYPIQSDRLCSGFEEKQSVELQSCLRIESPIQAKILLKASFIICLIVSLLFIIVFSKFLAQDNDFPAF